MRTVRGTVDSPMTRAEVEAKCLDILQEARGRSFSDSLVGGIRELEKVQSGKDLRACGRDERPRQRDFYHPIWQ